MAVGAVGNVVTDTRKGNINCFGDLAKSAAKGAFANGVGYGVSKSLAALKVKQIKNMPRTTRKAYLRDNIFHNSQASVNANLKIFADASFKSQIALVESQVAIFRSGIYSSVTSTITTLF